MLFVIINLVWFIFYKFTEIRNSKRLKCFIQVRESPPPRPFRFPPLHQPTPWGTQDHSDVQYEWPPRPLIIPDYAPCSLNELITCKLLMSPVINCKMYFFVAVAFNLQATASAADLSSPRCFDDKMLERLADAIVALEIRDLNLLCL